MILLYTSLLIFLGTISFLIGRRVASLEKKYARTAGEVEKLSGHNFVFKQGNSNARLDSCETAKQQYLLGQLVQKRDNLESKWHTWQARADKFNRVLTGLREWKGRKLPYTMGALDVSCLLYAIDYFGVGRYVSFQNLMHLVMSLFSQS